MTKGERKFEDTQALKPLSSELELLQLDRAMRLLMEGAGDFAIIRLDPLGHIVHWDEGAQQLIQYTAPEVLGRHFSLFYTDEDQQADLPQLALTDALELGRHNVEHWFVGKDKAGFWANNVVMPMHDAADKLIGFAMIVRNVTDSREKEAVLTEAKEAAEAAQRTAEVLSAKVEAANTDLREANDSLQRFTSIVAHDLRAPLRRIETFVKFLQDDYGRTFDAEGKNIMSKLDAGVVRMRLMLNSLLEYSKCSRAATHGKVASLSQIVDTALTDLDLNRDKSDISINLGSVDNIAGDARLLGHVVYNLISNAVKFARRDTPLQLRINARELTGNSVEVSVTDNGIGIEPRFAERVFEMLYRLHNDDEYEGTGIGLSVCRKIIRDHGGQIWIDPINTVGTRVVFTLLTHPAIGSLPLPEAAPTSRVIAA